MSETEIPLALAVAGVVAGLVALWRGFGAHGLAVRVADTASSRIATLAAGEVRVSGVVEPAEITLVSPLQGVECVWYRSSIAMADEGSATWSDERGIGFRVRDASGSIRVFPREARIDVAERFDDSTGAFGEEPIGLRAVPEIAMAAQVAGRRRYREARIEAGDTVTIVGSAIPFRDLGDPADADAHVGGALDATDPEVAGDIAEARAAGLLVAPEAAWGNAAIPGFGIGRPIDEPELDPRASRPTLATREEAAAVERTFDLPPDQLVLASGPDGQLLIAAGNPGEVTGRHEARFVLGLGGAVLAIGSALAAAWLLAGGASS